MSVVTIERCRFAVASPTRPRCQESAHWSCPGSELGAMWCDEHRHPDDVLRSDEKQ